MEQRSFTRIPFKKRVKFGHLDRPYYEAVTKDISESGIGLISYEYLPENTITSLIVYYGHKPLTVKGQIKWIDQDIQTKEYRIEIELEKSVRELNTIYNYLFK